MTGEERDRSPMSIVLCVSLKRTFFPYRWNDTQVFNLMVYYLVKLYLNVSSRFLLSKVSLFALIFFYNFKIGKSNHFLYNFV